MIARGFWNIGGWPRADEWSAWWALCTFVVTAVAATLAVFQLRAYLADRRAQARPYVAVDLVFQSLLMQVEVRNISATPATNVRLSVVPPFRSKSDFNEKVLARVTGSDYVIRFLAPERAIRWTLDSSFTYFAQEGLPLLYNVTATYDDPRSGQGWRNARLPRSYTETFELSLEQWIEANLDLDPLGQIVDRLEKIQRAMPKR